MKNFDLSNVLEAVNNSVLQAQQKIEVQQLLPVQQFFDADGSPVQVTSEGLKCDRSIGSCEKTRNVSDDIL